MSYHEDFMSNKGQYEFSMSHLNNNSFMEKTNAMPYVLVRTYSAGVHIGYLESRNGKEVKLSSTRRLWYWDGAASLSQIALTGVTKPLNCKFSVVLPSIELTEAIEIIPVSDEADGSGSGDGSGDGHG